MWRHTTALVMVFLMILLGFEAALLADSPRFGVAALVGGLVMAFVIAIAWSRPQGDRGEVHPKIDRIFDDTQP